MSGCEQHSPGPIYAVVAAEPAIEPSLSDELEEYKGRWVAVDGSTGHVVAAGSSATSVVEEALGKHITDPLVFRVPSHPERINML